MRWSGKLNKKYTQISAYVIVTAVIIYILSLVAKNAPTIMGEVMIRVNWLVRVIKPIIIGFVFAYLLDPVATFFQRRLMKRKRYREKERKARFHGVMITLLLIFIAFVAVISVLAYSINRQIRLANFDDIITLVQTYINSFTEFINSIMAKLQEMNLNVQTEEFQGIVSGITSKLSKFLSNTVSSTAGSISNITSLLTTLAFSIIIGIWFMIDGAMMTGYLNKVMFALFSKKSNDRVHDFLQDADEVFSGYIRGQLMDALVMMFLISISLSLVGVEFSVVIGVIAGLGNLIPYLGPFIAYAGTILVCLINADLKTLVIGVIVLAVIQAIDGNFIGPKLLSKSIEVHPLLVIISLIFGSAIGGFLGMLLAVPVGALLKLLFVRYIDTRVAKKQQEIQKEKEIEKAVLRTKHKE